MPALQGFLVENVFTSQIETLYVRFYKPFRIAIAGEKSKTERLLLRLNHLQTAPGIQPPIAFLEPDSG
jgi:hypothetical protein